jgi:lycopene cyclase domain-containing protein
MSYLYLLLDLGTFAGPLLLSFDKKVAFFKKWKYLFPSVLIMAIIFIIWDILFTNHGVWGFNPTYLTGLYFFSIPLEECLFFFVVPYASVFVYECIIAYFKDYLEKIAPYFFALLSVFVIIIGFVYIERLYTSITFISAGTGMLWMIFKKVPYLGRFMLAYLIVLIPFFIVNGVLTGTGIEDEVVWYNSNHILNIRILTIPIEDSIYNLLMFSMTIFFYNLFKTKY